MTKASVKKQFWSVLIFIIFICCILFIIAFEAVKNLVQQNKEDYILYSLQQFETEVEFMHQRMDALFSAILFDPTIENLLTSPFNENTYSYAKSAILQFSSFSLNNKDIYDIAIASDLVKWSNYIDSETLNSYLNEMENNYGVVNLGFKRSAQQIRQNNASKLVFGHNVYGMHNPELYGKCIGSIFISLDLSKTSIGVVGSENDDIIFFLMDKHGNYYSFSEDLKTSNQIIEEYNQLLVDKKEFSTYEFYTVDLNLEQFTLLCAADINKTNQTLFNTALIFLCVFVLVILLVCSTMFIIMKNTISPLNGIARYLNKASTNVPNNKIEPLNITGCKEIVTVSNALNNMQQEQARLTLELQETTINLYEAELLKKQAELDYLRSQINPHFLYNSLAMIQDMAIEKNVPQVAEMTQALGNLFRFSVKGSKFVTFKQELVLVDAYLEIQSARFENKFKVIRSIRPNIYELTLPKLLLQPIVENALIHGLAPKAMNGTLYIGAKLENNDLLINVYDDGVGIPSDELIKIQNSISDITYKKTKPSVEEHIGLVNVHQRICLRYGNAYGVFLESGPDFGTRVTIKLPADSANNIE